MIADTGTTDIPSRRVLVYWEIERPDTTCGYIYTHESTCDPTGGCYCGYTYVKEEKKKVFLPSLFKLPQKTMNFKVPEKLFLSYRYFRKDGNNKRLKLFRDFI